MELLRQGKKAFFFFVFLLVSITGQSQPDFQKIWTFGAYAGLDFSTGSPIPFLSSVNAVEGVATQCDASGQLLFYTDKNTVWNRNHNVMPNGTLLDVTDTSTSSTQGVVIIPWPGASNKYFIFSLSCVAGGCIAPYTNCAYLSYSVVDMNANGGLGDVTAGEKSIVIDSLLTEQMIGIKGDGCNNYWIVVHNKYNTQFKSYAIDLAGLNTTPVLSNASSTGNFYIESQGSFAYAARTKKIAAAARNFFSIVGVDHIIEMFDFNTTTGVVSNPQLLDSNAMRPYGICFSPDETKLYYTDQQLRQLDLSLPTIEAIRASKILISTDYTGALKVGPDGRMYVARPLLSGQMNFINQPNLAGVACAYNSDALSLASGSHCSLGLPNDMFIHTNAEDTALHTYTHRRTLCDGNALVLLSPVTGVPGLWNNGSTADSMIVTAPGTYWISSSSPCLNRVDTFIVDLSEHHLFLGNDTSICEGDEWRLNAPIWEGATYLWQDGSTSNFYKIKQSGKYKLKVSVSGCLMEDELEVKLRNCSCHPLMPTAFSPNQDGINDFYKPVISANCQLKSYLLQVYNRWGQLVYTSVNSYQHWDGNYKGQPAETGVYFYSMMYAMGENMYYLKGDLTLIR
jgi:gliding motility-associated-like protein